MKIQSKHALRASVLVTCALAGTVAVATSVGATKSDRVQHAHATLTDATGATVGFAKFTEDATGTVHVNVHVDGATPGLHGIHIHNTANCAPGATAPYFLAAGGHHNPLGDTHGSHAGDLPNLTVNGAGQGHLDGKVDHVTLSAGETSVFDSNGSALVLHALEDDLHTDPTGNSGARIACGVIE